MPQFLLRPFLALNIFMLFILPTRMWSPCFDRTLGPGLKSDCAERKQFCDDPLYRDLMADQCPMTCGRCAAKMALAQPICADQIGPKGVSDCPKYPERCKDRQWVDIMRQICPETCGFCPQPARLILQTFGDQTGPQFYDYPALVESINTQLRPCDDFYAFVCDGYMKARAVEYSRTDQSRQLSQMDGLGLSLDQNIIDILTKPEYRIRYQDNPLYSKAYIFNDACVNLEARERDRPRTMGTLFEEIRSVAGRMGATYTLNTEWLQAVFPVISLNTKVPRFGPQPPFLFPFLLFLPIPFGTTNTGQYAGNENVFVYELAIADPNQQQIPPEVRYGIIGDIMALVFQDDLAMNGPSPVLAPNGIPAGDQGALRQAVQAWVDNLRAIDQQLEQIHERFASPNPQNQYQTITLAEVHARLMPSIDWPAFLQGVDQRLGANTQVRLKCAQCFIELEQMIGQILASNPLNLRHYLETFIMLKYSFAFDPRFRQLTWGRLIPNIPPRTSTEAICMARTATHFEKQLDRLYIDNFFEAESRSLVLEMIRQTQAEFRRMLTEADWMGQMARQRALVKFDRMKALAGYFEEIKDDQLLARENSCYDFGTPQVPFSAMELQASRCTTERNIARNVLVDENGQMLFFLDEYFRSFEPNGAYEHTRNLFIVLAGILQVPFFDRKMPEPLRFGGVGVLIAHEITHGFDNRGRMYNEESRRENWWDPETERRFVEKSQCFVRQYGQFRVRIDEQTELPVNGELTLSENIPDNAGLKGAFRTLRGILKRQRRSRARRVLVRQLEQFSDEQLFFINFAFSFCSVEGGPFLRQQLDTDVHSPNTARVNLVTGNSQAFVDAFGCKEGDKMFIRASDRCELW